MVRCVALASALMIAGGCTRRADMDGSPPPSSPPSDTLEIVFYQNDPSGEPVAIASGQLLVPVDFNDMEDFDGTWQLNDRGAVNVTDAVRPDFVAPLAGAGRLHGTRTAERCYLDLNPGVVDDNVEITAPSSLEGEGAWEYVTVVGVTASGSVRIAREPD